LRREEQELVTAERERDEQKTEREDKTMMKNPYVCIVIDLNMYDSNGQWYVL